MYKNIKINKFTPFWFIGCSILSKLIRIRLIIPTLSVIHTALSRSQGIT